MQRVSLTMQVYTDPKLLDIEGALAVLPELPLASENRAANQTGQPLMP